MSLPKSAGEPASNAPPRSASRAFILGSTRCGVYLLVQLVDNLGRRVLRHADAEPVARLIARHEIAHGWYVGQRLRARRGCCARRLPALIYSIGEGMEANITCTRPTIRSVRAGAPPRYGT